MIGVDDLKRAVLGFLKTVIAWSESIIWSASISISRYNSVRYLIFRGSSNILSSLCYRYMLPTCNLECMVWIICCLSRDSQADLLY